LHVNLQLLVDGGGHLTALRSLSGCISGPLIQARNDSPGFLGRFGPLERAAGSLLFALAKLVVGKLQLLF
jgi:hypothetical protein